MFPGPHWLILMWWGCYGLCRWHKPTELAHSFLFCSCVCFCLYCPFNSVTFHSASYSLFPSLRPTCSWLLTVWSKMLSSRRCGLCFWHKPTELARSFLFCSCVYFCLYGPFNCISLHKFSEQLCFLTLFFRSFFCLTGSFNYIYLYESLPQPWL